jgi:hypothetical protein
VAKTPPETEVSFKIAGIVLDTENVLTSRYYPTDMWAGFLWTKETRRYLFGYWRRSERRI